MTEARFLPALLSSAAVADAIFEARGSFKRVTSAAAAGAGVGVISLAIVDIRFCAGAGLLSSVV